MPKWSFKLSKDNIIPNAFVTVMRRPASALMSRFDVGNSPPHQDRILPVLTLDADSVGILPANSAGHSVTGRDFNFYRLLVANESLNLADAGQVGIKCVG